MHSKESSEKEIKEFVDSVHENPALKEELEIEDDKYKLSSEDLFEIFLALISLPSFKNKSWLQIRTVCLTQKKSILVALTAYLDNLTAEKPNELLAV